MMTSWQLSPWVAEHQHRIGFGLQVFPNDTPADPAADIRRKLDVLDGHCAALGRPPETVLHTHHTGWLILAENEARLAGKLRSYFPEGLAARYSGPWENFVLACTPGHAVAHYQELADAGIQYFIVETLDAADEETIRLLATEVVPRVRG